MAKKKQRCKISQTNKDIGLEDMIEIVGGGGKAMKGLENDEYFKTETLLIWEPIYVNTHLWKRWDLKLGALIQEYGNYHCTTGGPS
eukprot:g32617.t1